MKVKSIEFVETAGLGVQGHPGLHETVRKYKKKNENHEPSYQVLLE